MKHKFTQLMGVAIACVAIVGVAGATQTFSEDIHVPSLKVGSQGSGGVTFFNGTIINTTTSDGQDNPVTLGDDVRIDGSIYRTEKGGDNSIKVSDGIIPDTTDTYSLGSEDNKFEDAYFNGDVYVDKTGYASIPASSCESSADVTVYMDAIWSTQTLTEDLSWHEVYCPIYLPHGATATDITIEAVDTSDEGDIEFLIHNMTTSELSSTGSDGQQRLTSSMNETVDNQSETYTLIIKYFDTGIDLQFKSGYITYTTDSL